MSAYLDNINQLTRQYNDAIRALENSYKMELSQSSGWNLLSSSLKREYSKRYQSLVREYESKRRQLLYTYQQANPQWAKARRIWGWIFFIGILGALCCCGASLPSAETPTNNLSAQTETTVWNADNLPVPYLKDATQYVSNPDHVLSQDAVDRMNVTLQQLDKELTIQSIVAVVNHIENDDPFRLAQDLGNKYGVGYNNRGLIIVVGYLDHSINISPGRALEADLTDAECHRLEQQYVVPAMRAEMPDSGMVYLVEALYSLMQKKELPQMSSLSSADDELDDEIAGTIGLTMLFLMVWSIFFLRLNRKYHWFALVGATSLLSNPFYESTNGGSFGGGFSGGGFGGGGSFGGGFSGGSFGGGSFGGGGATSRW
ncbi:MAG: TPM domain-containing protein [Prevotella sp.]|nr:TPM domain-containing protein [Prevotella sp.]